MICGPAPRYRIYSRPLLYLSIINSLLIGKIQSGKDCEYLEQDIATRNRIKFTLCTPKARVAIFLAVRSLIQEKQEVILSPYTISDVINMVICAGGIPVFADIKPGTCNIDPENIKKLINTKTGAVLITHLHGLSCEMDSITSICAKAAVPLIEDAAQAFGATYKGQQVGTFGEAGIYSFGMYKNINSFFGGMLVTANEQLYKRNKSALATFPYQETGNYLSKVISGIITDLATWPPLFKSFTFWIFRYLFLRDIALLNKQVTFDHNPVCKTALPESYLRRMTPLQAGIIRTQLSTVCDNNKNRIQNATIYGEGLQDIPEITLPPLRTDGSHIYTYFPIQVKQRDSLLKHLMKHGCDVAAQHLKNCADIPCFQKYSSNCPVTRTTAKQLILLPTYPRYSEQDIKRNISVIQNYYKG